MSYVPNVISYFSFPTESDTVCDSYKFQLEKSLMQRHYPQLVAELGPNPKVRKRKTGKCAL